MWVGFLFVVFYLMLIRPQQLRAKKRQELIKALQVGDRIETIGGLQGIVMSLNDDVLEVQIAPEVTVTLARRAISGQVGTKEVD